MSAAWAQPSAVETIDAEALTAAVRARDPRVAVEAARVMSARANVTAARTRPNPSVSVEREEPFLDGVSVPVNYLRLAVPFDLSGRRGLQIDAAETAVRAAEKESSLATFELEVAALRIFDDCARARLRVEILADARALLTRAVEIARARAKTGAAAGYEVQRFELELVSYDDELASARSELDHARRRLATAAGRAGQLDASTSLALPATLPALDALLGQAGERGDLRAARLRSEAAEQRARAARRGWVPMPTLTGGAMSAAIGDQTGTGYVAALELTIPIFDRGQGDQARAAAGRHLANAEAGWLQRQIPSAVHTSYAAFTAHLEQARSLAAGQAERLDVMVRAAEAAFREGQSGVVELLDAHRTARAIKLRELDLRHQVARDKRDLELAVGQRL